MVTINPRQPTDVILAIDPGRRKCGLALVDAHGTVLHHVIVPTPEIGAMVQALLSRAAVTQLVLGDRTTHAMVQELLRAAGVSLTPILVNEHHSSEEGRQRYFQMNPRKGWRRLLPVSLQTPPEPYDDYVAIILAERYLRSLPSP